MPRKRRADPNVGLADESCRRCGAVIESVYSQHRTSGHTISNWADQGLDIGLMLNKRANGPCLVWGKFWIDSIEKIHVQQTLVLGFNLAAMLALELVLDTVICIFG